MQNNKNELRPGRTPICPSLPRPRGLSWIGVCGPGVIVLGVSIGSGEFLLGPATFVKHGLSLLWVTLVAVFFQTVFNTELMRYTVATGEPVVTGFMRTRPGKTFWAWFYAVLYFLQIGWPAWAATAAGAIFFLFAGRLATPPADSTDYLPDRRRHVSRVRRRAAARQTHRAHARDAQLGAGGLHPRRLPRARRHLRAGRHLGFGAGRLHRLRHGARRVQLPARDMSTSCCSARWSAIRAAAACSTSRCRTGRATRATAWAAASATSRARSAARRCSSPRPGFIFEPDAANHAPLARLVAHRARRSVGHLLRRRLARHDAAGAAVRDLRPARHRHQGSGHQRGARADHRRHRRARGWACASRRSARGSCSRRSSTAWKA